MGECTGSHHVLKGNREGCLQINKSQNNTLSGFTLVEILIALGLFAVAAIGLLALFPIARITEKEGEEEVRATLIASGIMETLMLTGKDGSFRIACGMSNGVPVWDTVPPEIASSRSVTYDTSCEPLGSVPSAEVSAPITDKNATAVATLTLTPEESTPGIVTAEVVVASPVSAPAARRSAHWFIRLLHRP